MSFVTPGEKIRLAREYAAPKLSQAKLGAMLDVDRSDISRFETGNKSPSPAVITQIARLTGAPLEWFYEDDEKPPTAYRASPTTTGLIVREATKVLGPEVPVARTGFRQVPIYGSVPAGEPGSSYSDAIEYEEMPDWGGNFERWGRIITGDSMSTEGEEGLTGEGFEPGDKAIFENRRASFWHGVYCIKDGEDTFKLLGDAGKLIPCNSAYDPIDASEWNILGVCIRRIRMLGGGVRDVREYPYGFIHRPGNLRRFL